MARLRRHQLAYLTAPGWAGVHGRHPLLAEWARRGLPLVVTRQTGAPGQVTLGWPAPLSAGKLRVSLQVEARHVAWFDEFPRASAAVPLLARAMRGPVQALVQELEQLGAPACVYGSYGWQLLTGLHYLHAASDLDLWLPVGSEQQADAAVTRLQACQPSGLRIDGELMFPGGAAVAWREYAAWRAGRTRALLVKRIDAVGVETALALPAGCRAVPA